MSKLMVLFAILSLGLSSMAQSVTVHLTADDNISRQPIVGTIEYNLGLVLTEINRAQAAHRPLNLNGLPLNEFARNTLQMLWANVPFYCDDDYVVDRLWNFSNGYMTRQIPIIITPEGEAFGNGTFQEAIVEYDKKGIITDFRFTLDVQMGESLESGGDPADVEHRMQILQWCERFRTAYNTKDINFIRQMFSEDALIITGTVVTSRQNEMQMPQVMYKKQNKKEYMENLEKAFARNKWINVKFSEIGDGENAVTQSSENPNLYGVRLHQQWNSSNYHDDGYIFLLWDFTNEYAPVIHVRTWQPKMVGGKPLPEDEIFSMTDFEN